MATGWSHSTSRQENPMTKFTRRSILRGLVRGAAVGVALPYLDCFLGSSGQALAATGQRVPTRFGTWIWGCGFIPEKWIPTTTGTGYAMPKFLRKSALDAIEHAPVTCYTAGKPHLPSGYRSAE